MNILIYEPNEMLASFFLKVCVSKGLVPTAESDIKKVYSLLSSRKYEYFMTDYGDNKALVNDILINVKLDKRLAPIKIFMNITDPDKTTLQKLIKIGVNGFIKKPIDQALFPKTIDGWLSKHRFRKNKRTHARITPKPTDNAIVMIKTEINPHPLKFGIIDISAGGMAIVPAKGLEKFMPEFFKVNKVIHDVQIKIRHTAITVNIQVISVKNNRASFQFIDCTEENMQLIYGYMAENINN